ncbi:MAG: hypothetical protein WCP34_15365 [Pseudomonadota bacterium]
MQQEPGHPAPVYPERDAPAPFCVVLRGWHSVSINLSYRITLELLVDEQKIIPLNMGDHDAVY